MSKRRRRNHVEQRKPEAKKPAQEGKLWTRLTWALGIIVGVSVSLYLAGPNVEPKMPFISCAICDRTDQIRPPETANETGATVTLPFENTGSIVTTILNHNLTLRSGPEPYLSRDVGFSEMADRNDDVRIPLGAKSRAYLTLARNEAIVYNMRHGSPMGTSNLAPIVRDAGYLYGHITYRSAFYFPTTTNFCFQYVPPNKGLPESWGVCSNDVLAKIEATHH